jgi:hypothetical protein
MPDAAVYVVPDADFDDWIVRTDAGDEVAHYATREAAELVAQQIAKDRAIDLVVHLPDGRTTRKSFAKGWVSKLFGGQLWLKLARACAKIGAIAYRDRTSAPGNQQKLAT